MTGLLETVAGQLYNVYTWVEYFASTFGEYFLVAAIFLGVMGFIVMALKWEFDCPTLLAALIAMPATITGLLGGAFLSWYLSIPVYVIGLGFGVLVLVSASTYELASS